MIVDLHELPLEPFSFEAEICIVGAGAAGLSLARRLVSRGHTVALVESGALDYEAETARLAAGSCVGEPYYALDDARLRLFGGTTAIWGGRCAELDEIDFERRDWVPFSGWPFDKATLAPWYEQAWASLGMRRPAPGRSNGRQLGRVPQWLEGDFRIAWWMFDRKADRFGHAAQSDLLDRPEITVLLHATATELRLQAHGNGIDEIRIASLRGHRGCVRARHYVLAAGGLENPRLLLASHAQRGTGLGNAHDLVGRFFMEHPHARGGRLHTRASWSFLRAFGSTHSHGRAECAAMLCPSQRLQHDRQILNTSFVPRLRPHPDSRPSMTHALYKAIKTRANPTLGARRVWHGTRTMVRWLKRSTDPLRPWMRLRTGAGGLYLSVRAEQAPNLDSRVFLSEERDALGMPRLVLDWRLSELDKRTVRLMAGALHTRLQDADIGSVALPEWLRTNDRRWEFDPLISRHAIGGYHHMGTTRMADSPRAGVVDRDGKVHGTDNLWIAGSSVFPTSGWANPTLTIIALSLRLAERLHAALTPR